MPRRPGAGSQVRREGGGLVNAQARETYTVRVVGSTAWEEGLATLAAAEISAAQARDNGLRVVIVREPSGEVVQSSW